MDSSGMYGYENREGRDMKCLLCGGEVKGGEGDQPWRDCHSCHFSLHIFRKPLEREGIRAGGWTCEVGKGLGIFYPWGVLPVINERVE